MIDPQKFFVKLLVQQEDFNKNIGGFYFLFFLGLLAISAGELTPVLCA